MKQGLYINKLGVKRWYKDDELHCDDGPAVVFFNSSKCWYQWGKIHRTNGPAVEYDDGTTKWYNTGKLHRTDGPAVEFSGGRKLWYLNGEEFTQEQWQEKILRKTFDIL